eukprot:SAG31_NODE_5955_length_2243_cov_1.862873_2_plen_351_part_00
MPASQTFEVFVAATAPHFAGWSVVPWPQKHLLFSRPARVNPRWWQAQAQLARDAAAPPPSMAPPRQRSATTPLQLSSRTQPKSSDTVHGAEGAGGPDGGNGGDGASFATFRGVAVMKPHHPVEAGCFGTTRIVSQRPMPLVLVYQRGSGRKGFGGAPLVMFCQGPVGPSASAKKIDWPGPAAGSLSDQSTSHLPEVGFCQTHLPEEKRNMSILLSGMFGDGLRLRRYYTTRRWLAPRPQLVTRIAAALPLAGVCEWVEHIALIGPVDAVRARRVRIRDPAASALAANDVVHVPCAIMDLAPGQNQPEQHRAAQQFVRAMAPRREGHVYAEGARTSYPSCCACGRPHPGLA